MEKKEVRCGALNNCGYLTIEMALLFPLILFLIVTICFIGIYELELARLQSSMQRVLAYASLSYKKSSDLTLGVVNIKQRKQQPMFSFSSSEEEKELVRLLKQEIQDGFCTITVKQVKANIGRKHMKLTVQIQTKAKLLHYTNEKGQIHRVCCRVDVGDFSDWIRSHQTEEEEE